MDSMASLALLVLVTVLATLGLVGGAVVYLRRRAVFKPGSLTGISIEGTTTGRWPSSNTGLLAQRPCYACAHFDLDEGQAMKAQHHAFVEVSKWIPPADMSPQNAELDYNDPRRIPQKSQWSEYGACGKRREQVWGPWTGKQRHLTILKDEATGEPIPDCWTPRTEA